MVLYSLAPFTILIVFNVLMLVHVYQSHRRILGTNKTSNSYTTQEDNETNSKKITTTARSPKKSLNQTIIASTLLFIVMTLPTVISSLLWYSWSKTELGNFLINLFDDLTFTYHGLNFFILAIFNRKFRSQIIEITKSIFTTFR